MNTNKYLIDVKPIEQQINQVAKIFGLSEEKALEFIKKIDLGNKGRNSQWFAFPKLSALGLKYFPSAINPDIRYCKAVDLLSEEVSKRQSFFVNKIFIETDKEHLRQMFPTLQLLQLIEEKQPGDILVIECQIGESNFSRSVKEVRQFFRENEFGLTSFHVLSILLTHPKLISPHRNIGIYCAGDHFSANGDSNFLHTPSLYFNDHEHWIEFGVKDSETKQNHYGAATGFVPKF